MREIHLTRGLVALVDDEDYDALAPFKWSAQRAWHSWHAKRWGPPTGTVLMHRVIMNAPDGMRVLHLNSDGLDNRRGNLTLATPSNVACNRGLQSNNRSGRKGCSWDAEYEQWSASIGHKGKRIRLGRFDDIDEAAAAYDAASLALHRDFGRTNADIFTG